MNDRPPRLARWLLTRVLQGPARSAIVGDLDEEFTRFILPHRGPRAARRWYWRQTALSLAACLRAPTVPLNEEVEQTSIRRAVIQDYRGLVSDAKAALRVCTRRPIVSTVIVATLGLGIGANTAVFSIVNAAYVKKLPVANADRLVAIDSREGGAFTYQEFLDSRGAAGLDALVAGGRIATTFGEGTARERVTVELVTGNYFDALGVGPASLGRLFHEEDDTPGKPPIAIASESFWREHLRGDPRAIGGSVQLRFGHLTLVGVAPRGFAGAQVGHAPDFWVPLTHGASIEKRSDLLSPRSAWLGFLGVIAPGRSVDTVRASMFARWRDRGTIDDVAIRPIPRGHHWYEAQREQRLRVLGLLVVVTLLIGCLNVSTLLGAGIHARQKELAIRSALGAGRLRLLRQLLVEHLFLATAGGLLGGVLGTWLARLFVRRLADDFSPADLDVSLDLNVLAFVTAISLLAGLAIGLVPAARWSRVRGLEALQPSPSGGVRRMLAFGGAWWLIPWQVALGTVLLASGALLLKSVHQLELGLGITAPDRVWFASVDFDEVPVRESFGAFVAPLREAIQSSPGVETVALSTLRPLSAISRGPVFVRGLMKVPESQPMPWGPPPPPPPKGVKLERQWIVSNSFISPEFFRTLGVPVVQGRDFTVRDTRDAPRVAIVNQTFAAKAFGQGNPIGRRIGTTRPGSFEIEVVGVVRDMRTEHLRQPAPDAVFFPLAQIPDDEAFSPTSSGAMEPRGLTFVMRTSPGTRVSSTSLRQRIATLDARPFVDRVWTLDEEVGRALSQERLLGALGSLLGSLALVLLVIGLYGAMSAAVIRARREIGIRLALGATPRSLRVLVVGRGLAVVSAGLVIGLPLSYVATRFFAHLLFGVQPGDPAVGGAVAGILLLTAALAAYPPARQAARVDPAVVLRAE